MDQYRWHHLDEKALDVVPFHGHVSRLCNRVGKTGWALRGNAIRNTFPDWFRRKVDPTTTEEAFWTNVTSTFNIAMIHSMHTSGAGHADRNGDKDRNSKDRDSEDYNYTDFKNGDLKGHKDGDNRDRDQHNWKDKRESVKCQFCGYQRHELNDCRKMKATAAAQQQQPPLGQSRYQSQSGIICYNCQKPAHIALHCPEPKRLTLTPANPTVMGNYRQLGRGPLLYYIS